MRSNPEKKSYSSWASSIIGDTLTFFVGASAAARIRGPSIAEVSSISSKKLNF